MANHYDVPSWAGKPPTGLHLDVLKGDKLIQKLMLDEKKCYLFGRNSQMNDFCIDHASCSRVHTAFVYHKHLNRAFLVDLGSTHGTFIGQMRLEANKPTQLPIDSIFHFGASTRNYVIRERPSGNNRSIMEDIPAADSEGILLGLPESQTEMDNLTEFNTAHNRRISMLGISTDDATDMKNSSNKRGAIGVSSNSMPPSKRQRREVSFNEDVDIINPEDVDPSVGRFRNLVKTTIVPTAGPLGTKRMKLSTGDESQSHHLRDLSKHLHPSVLYHDLPPPASIPPGPGGLTLSGSMSMFGARLGMSLPNPAPDVDLYESMDISESENVSANLSANTSVTNNNRSVMSDTSVEGPQGPSNEPRKKKYAKEAWPGRKPPLLSGV